MQDRELLELAARAIGAKVHHPGFKGDVKKFTADGFSGWFDPLADDAHALRLAVKLDIGTDYNLSRVWAFSCTRDICEEEEKGRDPVAASRRAIVRAAAEIGKNC